MLSELSQCLGFLFQKSCAKIKEIVPGAKSGYYWINVKGKKKEVFCDMVNFGMFGHVVNSYETYVKLFMAL